MDISIFLLFCITVLILTFSPGPDIIFVITQSLQKGYKYGFKISFGLVTGLFIYTLASTFGLSLILKGFPGFYYWIKICGAVYIGFLAYKELPISRIIKSVNSKKNNPFFDGLIMNLSNPKIMFFFISLFPQFIFHDKLSITYQFLILGIVFIVIAFLIFVFVSIIASHLGSKSPININSKYFSYIQFIILGIISVLFFISGIKDIIKQDSVEFLW